MGRSRTPPKRPSPTTTTLRERLDSWFPTLVRYAGLGVVIYETGVDRLHNAALLAAGVGMIAFKRVWGSEGKAK